MITFQNFSIKPKWSKHRIKLVKPKVVKWNLSDQPAQSWSEKDSHFVGDALDYCHLCPSLLSLSHLLSIFDCSFYLHSLWPFTNLAFVLQNIMQPWAYFSLKCLISRLKPIIDQPLNLLKYCCHQNTLCGSYNQLDSSKVCWLCNIFI